MGNENVKPGTENKVYLQAETMKQLGFSPEEVDKARKPEGFISGGCAYFVLPEEDHLATKR